jgi:hypothetical protein
MENEREFTQVIRFRPVEWALLVYLVFTGLLNIVYFKTLGATWVHLGARITIFSGLMLLIILQIRFNSRFIDFLRSFYPLATLGYLYGETDFYNNIWHNYLDAWFEKTDFFIFGFQPSIRFSEVFHWTWFQELMSLSYMSYFLMIFGVLWAIYRFNREYFNRSIFIVLQSFFFYYLIFIVFPVQGPQFWFPAPLNGLPEGGVFHNLLRFIQSVGERPTGAFPSSHVGISVILCYLSYQYARPCSAGCSAFWCFFPARPFILKLIISSYCRWPAYGSPYDTSYHLAAKSVQRTQPRMGTNPSSGRDLSFSAS